MPPKQPFSADRAREFGDLAVAKAIDSIGKEGLPSTAVLDCAYRGVGTPDGMGISQQLRVKLLEETGGPHARQQEAERTTEG